MAKKTQRDTYNNALSGLIALQPEALSRMRLKEQTGNTRSGQQSKSNQNASTPMTTPEDSVFSEQDIEELDDLLSYLDEEDGEDNEGDRPMTSKPLFLLGKKQEVTDFLQARNSRISAWVADNLGLKR